MSRHALLFIMSSCYCISFAEARTIRHPDYYRHGQNAEDSRSVQMIYDGRGDYDLGGVWGGRDDTLVWPNEDLMNNRHSDYYANRLHGEKPSWADSDYFANQLHSEKPSWTAFLGHKEMIGESAWDQRESLSDHGSRDRDYYGRDKDQRDRHERERDRHYYHDQERKDYYDQEREDFYDQKRKDFYDQEKEDFCDGGDSCCQNHPSQRCGIGEGDCDEDMDCERGLVCGRDNCRAWGSGFDSTDDCCRDPCDGEDSCCSRDNACKEGEGDCDSDADCEDELKCGKDNCRGLGFDSTDDCCYNPKLVWGDQCQGGDSCCTRDNQCFEGEGDCDHDSDCRGNLRCGTDNCYGKGFDDTDDCCMRPW